MPIIMKALVRQKSLFYANSVAMNNDLNQDFAKSYTELENSFNTKLQVKSDFSQDEIKKIDAMLRLPYQKFQVQKNTISSKSEVKSAAYTELCVKNQERENQILALKKPASIIFTDPLNGPKATEKVNFDIENHLTISGDRMICELINVMGLLSEHNFKDIDLVNLEQSIASYDESLKFIAKKYLPKQEDK